MPFTSAMKLELTAVGVIVGPIDGSSVGESVGSCYKPSAREREKANEEWVVCVYTTNLFKLKKFDFLFNTGELTTVGSSVGPREGEIVGEICWRERVMIERELDLFIMSLDKCM